MPTEGKSPGSENRPPPEEGKGVEPFHRFPVWGPSSLKEWERVAIETFGANSFSVPSPENVWARANFLGLDDVTLGYGASGPRFVLDYHEAETVKVRLVLNGSVQTRSGSTHETGFAGRPTIASPGQATTSDFSDNLELMFFWISS